MVRVALFDVVSPLIKSDLACVAQEASKSSERDVVCLIWPVVCLVGVVYVAGAFLIPYVICLIFMGIPLFALEISFGQYGGKGPLTIWNINPVAKGTSVSDDSNNKKQKTKKPIPFIQKRIG